LVLLFQLQAAAQLAVRLEPAHQATLTVLVELGLQAMVAAVLVVCLAMVAALMALLGNLALLVGARWVAPLQVQCQVVLDYLALADSTLALVQQSHLLRPLQDW